MQDILLTLCSHNTKIPLEWTGLFVRVRGETLQGVFREQKNGVKKYREQRAWGQKDEGAGARESYLASREQKILGIVSKNLTHDDGSLQ